MKKIIIGIILIIMILIFVFLRYFNILPQRTYTNRDFNIADYHSNNDQDGDTIDDAWDILQSAREYVAKKPIYKSKYYANGYPDDAYGVCTDVVAFALLNSGYDLKELVNADIKERREEYDISTIDKNIDFRRVNNLNIYFSHHAQSLTTDLSDIAAWQAGDIVVFTKHIGIISDRRNKKGIPYLIHNAGRLKYEEDFLTHYEIVAHYRIS